MVLAGLCAGFGVGVGGGDVGGGDILGGERGARGQG